VKYNKPALTFEQQLDLLISRGMQVDDREKSLHYLAQINYYRLAAYWLPYTVSPDNHQFKPGTTFELVLDHYLFDREFRLLLLDAIERIEISFRTQWAYHLSHRYGPHGFLLNNKSIRKDERRHNNDIQDLKQHIQRSDEMFIKHFEDTYDEQLPPAWVSCEVMSLGLLSRFYSNLRAYKVRQQIAATYQFDEGFLEGFMEHLSYVRNVCAHHSRLWNRHLSKKMPLPKGKPSGLRDNIHIDPQIQSEHRIYNTLVVVQHLMMLLCPDNHWFQKLSNLTEKYSVDVKAMGFPEMWIELPVWQ
jgi:abortive infection bacteriophage resistance protein